MTPFRIPPATRIGRVHLRVADLGRALEFYGELLGLEAVAGEDGSVRLAVRDGAEILRLEERPGAPPKPRHTTGLYHYAILVPTRPDLARTLLRLRERRWPLQGASDHAVSEALYLSDPDGNGVEIYADRPRDRWQRRDGELYMTTAPLDLHELLADAGAATGGPSGLPPSTRIGHIHLHVSDLGRAESFYHGTVGFDVTTRGYPGALFLSAGGYHHHIGLNTWAGEDAPPTPADAVGLEAYEIVVPGAAARAALLERLREAGAQPTQRDGAARVEDPDGIVAVITD